MRETVKSEPSDLEEIRILIFNIMDLWFGIDMEQISAMYHPDQVKERDFELCWFHKKLLFRKENISYKSPMILLIKQGSLTTGLVIDQPEDINIPVFINDIQPLPPLIEASKESSSLWSVTLIDGKIILLIDAYKLIASQDLSNNNFPSL